LEPEARAVKADEVAPGNRRTLLRGNVLRIEFRKSGHVPCAACGLEATILAFSSPRRQVRPGIVW